MTELHTTTRARWGVSLTVLLVMVLASAVLAASPARAQGPVSIEVSTLDYDGPGSLRAAIEQANADTSGGDITITFAAGLNGYIALDGGTDMVGSYGIPGSFLPGGSAYLIHAGAPVTIDFDNRVGIANINDASTSAFIIDSADVTIRNFDTPELDTSTNEQFLGTRTIRGIVSSESVFVITPNGTNATLTDGACVEEGSNWMERCVAVTNQTGNSPVSKPTGTSAAGVTLRNLDLGDPFNAGVVFQGPSAVDGFTLDNVTMTNDTQSFAAVFGRDLEISNFTMVNSTIGSVDQAWRSTQIIELNNSSIENATFNDNTFVNMQNGIRYVFQHGNAPFVRNVEYSGNTFTDWSPDRNWDFTDAFILEDVRITDNVLEDSTPLNVVDARNVRTSVTDFVFTGNTFTDYETRGGWKVLDFRSIAGPIDGLDASDNEATDADLSGGFLDLSGSPDHRNVTVTANTFTDGTTNAGLVWVNNVSGASEAAGDLNVFADNVVVNSDPADVNVYMFVYERTNTPAGTDTGWRVHDNHFASAHHSARAPIYIGSGRLPVERNTFAAPARGTTMTEDDSQLSETDAAWFVWNVNGNANGKYRTWVVTGAAVQVDSTDGLAQLTVAPSAETPTPPGPVDIDVYYTDPSVPAGGGDAQRHAEQYLGRIVDAQDGGTYQFNCAGCNAATGFLRVQTIAADGSTTQYSGSVVAEEADLTPAGLAINLADNDTLVVGDTITGTGVAGSEVTVHEDGMPGNVICGPVVVPASGQWSCDVPTSVTPGTYDLVATDDDGPTTTTPVLDVTIEPIPMTLDLTAGEDVVPGEDIGGTATPGADVTVSDDSGVICTTVADANGSWACPLPLDTPPGPVNVTATDGTTTEGPVAVNVLPVPVTMDLQDGQEVPAGSTISGTGDPDATVTVQDGDGTVVCGPAIVDGNGEWSCVVDPGVVPEDGAALTAVQTGPDDTFGPVTVDLVSIPVAFDPSVADGLVAGTDPITGTGAPGQTVTVLDEADEVVCGPVTVAPDGSWSCDLPADFPQGPIALTAEQRNDADEVTSTDDISTTVSSPAPTSDLTDGVTLTRGVSPISGTGVPGAEVTVTNLDGDVVCGPVTVDASGSWTCVVHADADLGDTALTVSQDIDGTVVADAPVNATIVAPPPAPGPLGPESVELDLDDGDEVEAGSTIGGTGEPGTTVQVVDGDGAVVCGPVTVGTDGTWSCTLPADIDPGTTTLIAQVIEDGDVVDESDPVEVEIVDGEAPVDPGEVSGPTRLGGLTRIETANAISQDSFDDGTASIVVLARSDNFADALAGTPLAVSGNGPVLLTPPDQLLPEVAAEIERVLVDDGRIFLLGGLAALNEDVETASAALGEVIRLQGASRVETAIDIARELGDPELLLVTTGGTFPDALSAATAAAANDGAILLTTGAATHPSTDAYLAERDVAPDLYAVGGPAAAQYTDATPIVGASRTETAVQVAEAFFDSPTAVGMARQDEFADALTGGAHIARQNGPVLLTASEDLPDVVVDYVCGLEDLAQVFVYGGTAAVGDVVFDEVDAILGGTGGCAAG